MCQHPIIVVALFAGVLVFFCGATVAQTRGTLTGTYVIHGGGPPDFQPPTPQNTKMHISFGGDTAKVMFDALGAGSKTQSCGGRIVETRHRGDLHCLLTATGHHCTVGLDLKSGKSLISATC